MSPSSKIRESNGTAPFVFTPRMVARDLLLYCPLPKLESIYEERESLVKAEPKPDEDEPWVHSERIDLTRHIKQSIEDVKMEDHEFAPTSLLESFSYDDIEIWIESVVNRRLSESNSEWLASLRADDIVSDLKRRAENNDRNTLVGFDIANHLNRMELDTKDETLADRFRRLRLEIRDIFGMTDPGTKKTKRDRKIANSGPKRILPLRHAKRIRLDDGTWKRVEEHD